MNTCSNAVLFLLLSLLLASCTTETTTADLPKEAEERPADWLFRQRAYPFGEIDHKAYKRAVQYRSQVQAMQQGLEKDLNTTPWTFDGPLNVGGRITDVEVIPGTPRTILVGAASGGVFRSTNEGATWDATFDDMPTLAIGDLAIAPSNTNIVYAGTGEANAGGGSLAYDGLGVFRSTDGGQNWESRGLNDVGSIGRVVVDPTDPDRLYVAAMGTLFANNDERGVFRSLDGGENWEQVLFLSDSTGAVDLAIHPSDPMTIYAAMWERVRRPNRRQYTGITSGIYKSTDGGSTWQELGNGLPSAANDKGRISLAIAPSDPNRVYAGFVNSSGFLGNMMQSNNAGASWSNVPTETLQVVPFDWWFNRVVVDPTDADQLYYVGFNINKYIPIEERWELRFNGAHVDQHTLWINPSNPQEMLLGNDGGLYYTSDTGESFSKWENLPITQFYTCEIDFHDPSRRYGGTQDNGTNRTVTGNLDDWQWIYGGDGFRVRVDPMDQNIVYATSQFGGFGKSTNGGDFFNGAFDGLGGTRRNWYTPYQLDPAIPERLYLGTERIMRSDGDPVLWEPISPDLTNGNGGSNGLVYGTITSLSVSALDNEIIWVGTDDGNVWVSTDAGGNWNSISTGLPLRWVTSITADPNDPAGAYLTFSGFRYGTNMSHVYKTEDFGASWQNINGDLPDIPVNDLVVHPDNDILFLATDIGVFFTDNTGVNWEILGTGLPPVVTTDLTLHLPTQTLAVGTYGRSMWSINVDVDVNTQEPLALIDNWSVYPNPISTNAVVSLEIQERTPCQLQLVNAQGQVVQSILNGTLEAGAQELSFAVAGLPAGAYILQLNANGKVSSKTVVVQ
ncbi:MAG: T9SS type A sorting domain-containing protein [Bacteroidota bacterium]